MRTQTWPCVGWVAKPASQFPLAAVAGSFMGTAVEAVDKEELLGPAAETFNVHSLKRLYNPDPQIIEAAKKNQAAVWQGEKPEVWPIFIEAPLTADQERIPDPNYEEAFYNVELMLCSQIRLACAAANSASDAVPSIRANLGTGSLLSCVGLEQDVFPDKMPWLKHHLTKDEISRLEPDDIKIRGTFERGLGYYKYYKEVMGDSLALYCLDTQGPFDLAHLMMGDDLFYAMYDDPPFVHHLMNLCLELGIRTHTWVKEITGEPLDKIYHSYRLYAENMGIRICEDTTAIINSDHIQEFALPYTQKLAEIFGGAWIHYCGRNDDLTDFLLAMPEIKGMNFGHIPGHEHDHSFEEDMDRCLSSGKVYYGDWPLYEGESGRDYLKRLHRWAAQGCLIPDGNNAVGGEGGFNTVSEALEFWRSL